MGLMSKIYKELKELNTRKKNPIKKLGKGVIKHVSKEDIMMANGHIKRCLTSPVIL